jgi:hypothetical protein
MKTVKIKCCYCGKESEKPKAEINRQKRKGRKDFYCNMVCAGKVNYSQLIPYQLPKEVRPNIGRERDEFSPFRYHIKNMKSRSKEYNREMSVDIYYLKELWDRQEGKCAITNIPLIHKYMITTIRNTPKSPYQASIDRIDNSKGYVKGNVRFVCLMYNFMRNDFTDEQVLEFLGEVTKYTHSLK